MAKKIDFAVVDYGDHLDLESIKKLVNEHRSFHVVNVDARHGTQSNAVDILEKIIECAGMKCRVRTNNRGWLGWGGVAAAPFTFGISILAPAFIVGHNMATINPDYEIVKNVCNNGVTVEYMK